ncbi:MAG: histidine kinase, partial [Candidatus Eremiobacteraeota bacterium]|nr:histidine kinase [Candidatus Eremiobacteraeota bacterium]
HTLDEHPGHGLGLALAQRIVERHGGRIWIESNPTFGITVFFQLEGER